MFSQPVHLAFLGQLGWLEIIALSLLGVLIFGKRLPEVGKSLGKGIVEFKKGLSGIEDDLDTASKSSNPSNPAPPPKIEQQPEATPTMQTPATEPEPEHRPSS